MKYMQLALTLPGFNGSPSITISPPNTVACGTSSCTNVTTGLINLMFLIAIILCLAYLLWGGIDWISSGGDKTKFSKARLKLIYAIIGLIVVFFAYPLVNFIGALLGLPLTNPGQ